MATNPTLITTPFAQSGDKTTPPNTNTPSDGRFSQTLGFPPVTAIPLGSGGKAPKREDFNGAFNMLSNIAFYAQKGWIFQWDSGQSYYAGCIVRYSGNLYACTSDVTSTTNPASDTSHWSKYNISPGTTYAPINSPAFTGTPTAPTPSSSDNSTKIATTAFVKAAAGGGGYNSRDVKTTSGNYAAPVTGWYKITVKGGGGGGASGAYASSMAIGGGGGGEGGTTIGYEYMTAGATASVTIGAGGSGGSVNGQTGNSGTSGGNSTVTVNGNTYTGGGGGGGTLFAQPAAGGTGTIIGCAGSATPGYYNFYCQGGSGGGNGGGKGGYSNSVAGSSGTQGGGGGGGGAHASNSGATAGASGGAGYAWFEYFAAS